MREKHEYKQAKELNLEVIKMAKTSHTNLKNGLPAFYTLLGMNALAQGKLGTEKSSSRALYKNVQGLRAKIGKHRPVSTSIH